MFMGQGHASKSWGPALPWISSVQLMFCWSAARLDHVKKILFRSCIFPASSQEKDLSALLPVLKLKESSMLRCCCKVVFLLYLESCGFRLQRRLPLEFNYGTARWEHPTWLCWLPAQLVESTCAAWPCFEMAGRLHA